MIAARLVRIVALARGSALSACSVYREAVPEQDSRTFTEPFARHLCLLVLCAPGTCDEAAPASEVSAEVD